MTDTRPVDDVTGWAIDALRGLVPLETWVPVYGSEAWAALPADSPLRLAAAISAAEAWRADTARVTDELAGRLDAERAAADAELLDAVGAVALAAARTRRVLLTGNTAGKPAGG